MTQQEGQLIELDPKVIMADPKNNARFGLRRSRIKELASQITEAGGVMEPIEVSPVEGEDGFQYRINFGNYRHAAVQYLNEQGAGLTIPAIIRPTPEGKETLLRNLIENVGRQQLTPMDEAHAIKLLMDNGLDKMKIRELFARPGRKGPASNSWVNITLGFLELPKTVQNKIHEGEIDWDGGAKLVKVKREDPDSMQTVLAKLEEARKDAIAKEEAAEERYLASLKKAEQAKKDADREVAEAEAKEAEKSTKIEKAKAELAKAKRERGENVGLAQKDLKEATAAIAKAKGDDAVKAATVEVSRKQKFLDEVIKSWDKEVTRVQNSLDKLEAKLSEEATAAKEKAKEARKTAAEAKVAAAQSRKPVEAKKGSAGKGKGKAQSGRDVKKAAAEAGSKAKVGRPSLSRQDIMEVVREMALPAGAGKAEGCVQAIGHALKSCFDGAISKDVLYRKLLLVCGGK